MADQREKTIPVQSRMTESLVARVDQLAREFHLTRAGVVTLIVAAAVQREDDLLATYRELTTRTRLG